MITVHLLLQGHMITFEQNYTLNNHCCIQQIVSQYTVCTGYVVNELNQMT